MGGIDINNFTGQILDCLEKSELSNKVKIVIVLGSGAPWLTQVEEKVGQSRFHGRVLVDITNMAEVLTESDVAIGAAGSSALERCCLGVPSYVLSTAKNQKEGALALKSVGAIYLSTDPARLVKEVCSVFANHDKATELEKMSFYASQITEGIGVDNVLAHLVK
jgi:spore coat polysaccharide biosynthesis predicted glycosyltransferase SpsG